VLGKLGVGQLVGGRLVIGQVVGFIVLGDLSAGDLSAGDLPLYQFFNYISYITYFKQDRSGANPTTSEFINNYNASVCSSLHR
jgi:D-alanyl-lipoteichoic acid acyltransferase DltB (MBOAT superfamily)